MKLQVFISSTSDLYDWREKLGSMVKSLGHQEILWEHGHVAGTGKTVEEECYQEVRKSHILIAIAGTTFGSKSAKYPVNSVFQGEVREAREAGIPIIFFQSEQLIQNLRKNTQIELGVKKFDQWCKSLNSPPLIMMPLKSESQVSEAVSNQLSVIFANMIEGKKRLKPRQVPRSLLNLNSSQSSTGASIDAMFQNAVKEPKPVPKHEPTTSSESIWKALLEKNS